MTEITSTDSNPHLENNVSTTSYPQGNVSHMGVIFGTKNNTDIYRIEDVTNNSSTLQIRNTDAIKIDLDTSNNNINFNCDFFNLNNNSIINVSSINSITQPTNLTLTPNQLVKTNSTGDGYIYVEDSIYNNNDIASINLSSINNISQPTNLTLTPNKLVKTNSTGDGYVYVNDSIYNNDNISSLSVTGETTIGGFLTVNSSSNLNGGLTVYSTQTSQTINLKTNTTQVEIGYFDYNSNGVQPTEPCFSTGASTALRAGLNSVTNNLPQFYLHNRELDGGKDSLVIDSNGNYYFNSSVGSRNYDFTQGNLTSLKTVSIDTSTTDTLTWNNNGNIQIGNASNTGTSPTLMGQVTSNDRSGLFLISGSSNTNTGSDMQFDIRKTDDSNYTTTTGSGFIWSRYNNPLMTLTRDGKLGIGTTNPTEPLQVTGNAIMSGNMTYSNSSTSINFTELAFKINNASKMIIDSSKTNFNNTDVMGVENLMVGKTISVDTGSTNTLSWNKSGNIQIGNGSSDSTVPIILGQVTADNKSGLFILAGSSNTNSGPDMHFDIRKTNNTDYTTQTSSGFIWSRYGSPIMCLTRDGKLGIGTTTPTELLEVNGNIKASNFIGDGSQLTNLPSSGSSFDNSATLQLTKSTGNGLEVTSDVSIGGNMTYSNTSSTSINFTELAFKINNASKIIIDSSNTNFNNTDVIGVENLTVGKTISVDTGSTNTLSWNKSGNIQIGNGSGSSTIPLLVGQVTADNKSGLFILGGSSNTNSGPDMHFDIRKSDGSDYTTTTGSGFIWSRYNNNLMTLTRDGKLGIGTISPKAPIHIANSTTTNQGINSSYLILGNYTEPLGIKVYTFTDMIQGTTNNNYGLWVNDYIYADHLILASDERIKNNIQDITTIEGLNILKQIKPKTFNYVDTSKNINKQYGFIAQEIKEILPDIVDKITDFIPNIFSILEIKRISNILTIIVDNDSIELYNNKLNLKIIDDNKQSYIVKIKNIDLNQRKIQIEDITTNKKTIMEGKYFIYGQEIEDFHNLNHDAIFTLAISSIQELDKQLEKKTTQLNNKTNELEEKINHLEKENNDLKYRLERLEQILINEENYNISKKY